jgi:pyridoxine 4-dehydrogenase
MSFLFITQLLTSATFVASFSEVGGNHCQFQNSPTSCSVPAMEILSNPLVFKRRRSPTQLMFREEQSSGEEGERRRVEPFVTSSSSEDSESSIGGRMKSPESISDDNTRIGNLEVPSLGVGTISWSSDSLTTLENLELQSLVNEAVESNAAFFDTAERYGSHLKTALGLGWGETEMMLQKLLKHSASPSSKTALGNLEKDSHDTNSIIATKFTPSPWRTTAESVVEACEQSRRRLGVEQIDLYQLHMPDIVKPFRFLGFSASLDEIYSEGLAECYRRGLVKNVGVSNYGPTLVTKCHDFLAKRGVPLASNQIAYSLIGRQLGAQETVDACAELGVKVLAYYPFAMGLLTGKYSSDSIAANESMTTPLSSSKKTSFELNDLNIYARGDGKTVPEGGISPLLSTMEKIADKRGKTIAQVALNYIICKGAIPIPGARSKAQVKDNIGAMGWRLTEEEVATLENEADKLGFAFEGAGFKRTSEKFVGYGVEKWRLD